MTRSLVLLTFMIRALSLHHLDVEGNRESLRRGEIPLHKGLRVTYCRKQILGWQCYVQPKRSVRFKGTVTRFKILDVTKTVLSIISQEDGIEKGQVRIVHVEEDVLKKSGATLMTVEKSLPEQRQSWMPGRTEVRRQSHHLSAMVKLLYLQPTYQQSS